MSSVQQLESLLHDQPVAPLRPNQVIDYQEEATRLKDLAEAPQWQGGERGAAVQRYNQIQRLLREQAPKPIDEPMRRDQVAKQAQEVLATEIIPAMLPRTAMRRNPAGAVDSFLKRENSPAIKKAILTWKRAMRALDPTNTDQDYTNIEKFRPEGVNPDGTSTFMADAQIPGVFAMSPAAKANWPLGAPTVDTALGQVKKRELSEKQKAAIERMHAGRKAAAAARRGDPVLDEPPVTEPVEG